MAVFLRPDANVTQTSFTGGFAEIDEATFSDADFAYGAGNTAAVLEVHLSDPGGTPQSGTVTIRFRYAKVSGTTLSATGGTVTVTAGLYQGTTLIGSTTVTTGGTFTAGSFTVATSSVTNWNDLRLRFTQSLSGGGGNSRGAAISWAEVETPDLIVQVNVAAATSTQAATTSTGTVQRGVTVAPDTTTQAATSLAAAVTRAVNVSATSDTQTASAGTGTISRGVALTGLSATQANTTGVAGISYTSILAATPASQANASGTGTVSRSITLAAAASTQAATSQSVAVSRALSLTAAGAVQSALSSTGDTIRYWVVLAANAVQSAASSVGAVARALALVGAASAQANASPAVSVQRAVTLGAAPSVQQNSTSVVGVDYKIILASLPTTQTATASSAPVVVQERLAISDAIRRLEPGAIVELFELDLTALGGELLRFHAGTNALLQNVTWAGNVYTAFPVAASGFEFNGQGQAPRPKLQVSNVIGSITALVLQYADLVGAKVTRRRTLVKYLDSVNFPNANPLADATAEFPPDVYFIDRKAVETNELVEFELSPAMEVTGVMLPRRQIIQNTCPWKYRSAECGYNQPVYYDANDVSVASATADVCGKRLSSCEKRFGTYNELPFGGFPAAGLTR